MSPRRKKLLFTFTLVALVVLATTMWVHFSWYGATLWEQAWPADKREAFSRPARPSTYRVKDYNLTHRGGELSGMPGPSAPS